MIVTIKTKKKPNVATHYMVTKKDLPLSCPMPNTDVWNMHPKVYLPIEDKASGEINCPYCGSKYILKEQDK